MNIDILKMIHNSILLPHIDYGYVICGNLGCVICPNQVNIDRICKLQKQAARVMLRCNIQDISFNEIFKTTNWMPFQVGLCTGTRLIVIPVNKHRYQNRYGHSYSFDIHFDMSLTKYTWKMQEIYVFCGELCWKSLCWHVIYVLPLFCTDTRLSKRLKIQEISFWEDIEEAFLVGISRIKQCFYCN